MKRALIVVGIVLVVLLAAAGGAYWWISRPVALQAFDEPGPSAAVKQQNSLVQTSLLAEGIEASLVDVDDARAYVAYDAPIPAEGAAFDADGLQAAVLDAVSIAAPDAPRAVIVMYVDGAPHLIWKADLDALRALPADEGAASDAYDASIERIEL